MNEKRELPLDAQCIEDCKRLRECGYSEAKCNKAIIRGRERQLSLALLERDAAREVIETLERETEQLQHVISYWIGVSMKLRRQRNEKQALLDRALAAIRNVRADVVALFPGSNILEGLFVNLNLPNIEEPR